jgi:argininosuccinate lyase
MDVADEVRLAATVFARVFDSLRVNADAMRGACSIGFLNATDVADTLARTRGLAFRDCYKVVGAAVVACEAAGVLSREAINAELARLAPAPLPLSESEFAVFADPVRLLMQRTQVGSPHPDRVLESLEQMRADFDEVIAPLDDHRENFVVAHESLWSQVAARLA